MAKKINEKQMNEVLECIFQISDEVYGTEIDPRAVQAVLKTLKKVVKYDAASLYYYNPEKRELQKIESVGGDVELLTELTGTGGNGLSGFTLETNQPILIADRTKKSNFNPDEDYASFLSVPLFSQEQISGVINFGGHTANKFSETDVTLMRLLASFFALVLEKQVAQTKYANLQTNFQLVTKELQKYTQQGYESGFKKITADTAEIIHGINNSLSIILGNIQCLTMSSNEMNQKALSRIKRMEIAAKKIIESNQQLLELHALANNEIQETTG